MKLKDKVALVTGASSGIGKEIALEFAREGAIVWINYANNEEGAREVQAAIGEFGGTARIFKGDVADSSKMEELVEAIVKEHGRIDILVNNSGITRDKLMLRMEVEDFEEVLNVNLKGAFLVAKYASKYMLKARSGKIINMSSVVGITGNAGQANYAASKGGVIALTKSLAKEFGARNIQVNAIAPGYIETRMTEVLSDKVRDAIVESIPMKRVGKPADIAKTAVFLASEDSNYITGQVINVDGGMVM